MKRLVATILASLVLAGIVAPVPVQAHHYDSHWGPRFAEGNTMGCPGANCRNIKYLQAATCGNTGKLHCRFSASRNDGIVRLPYWINPTRLNPDSPYTDEQVIKYIRWAFRNWEYAIPSVRFIYKGTTDRIPTYADGYSDVGFFGEYAGKAQSHFAGQEFDINLSATGGGTFFAPCRFHCPAVKPYQGLARESMPEAWNECCDHGWRQGTVEATGVFVHEIGHVLGLDHPGENSGCASMSYERYGGCDPAVDRYEANPIDEDIVVSRHMSSPALGEILAMRYLYPYKCPPTPKGYKENPKWSAKKKIENRKWLPWRYRQVCPTIAVPNP
jgi:hypothetical protein